MSLLDPKIEASTLSVLMSSTDSILCSVELDDVSSNINLRFEGDMARIAGYPQNWRLWNESLGDTESTYEDAELDGSLDSVIDEIEAMDAYVSRKTEKEIFFQLKKSLQKQFDDEMFKDQLSDLEKQLALTKIDLAVKAL